jgi:rsbT co-antagonist protein RsbR
MSGPTFFDRFFTQSLELMATADTNGYFRHLNPAWEEVLGYSLEELKSRPFLDFVHPDDIERTNKEVAKLFSGVEVFHFENRYRRKDGSYCWMAWAGSVSAEDQMIFCCARDISAQKQLAAEKEQALSALGRFRALADSTSDFVGMFDTEYRVMYINPAGLRMLGRADSSTAGLHLQDIHSPEHGQQIFQEVFPVVREQGSWTGETWLRHESGQLIPVSQVMVALRSPDGQLEGYGTVLRDLSAIESYKKTQEELLRQQAMLREMLQAMATPIIPLTERIVVMPLIGSMDSSRAEDFLTAALQGAESRRAQVVIIDITGMMHVDTSVGATLVRAAMALRLLGAEVVLTGIRAEIARTLVSLGVDLPVNTCSNLQSGIAYALSVSGEVLAAPAGKSKDHPG